MDTSTNLLSVADAEGVLSLVPHMLGFHPQNSMVLLVTTGVRLVATLRVDLPPEDASPAAARRHARRCGRYLDEMTEASAAFIVTYSRSRVASPDGQPPHGLLVRSVAEHLAQRSIAVPDAWHVGAGGWRSHFCTDLLCCPADGHALESIWLSDANLELQFGGSSPGLDHWDGTTSAAWPGTVAVRDMVDSITDGVLGSPEPSGFLRRWCDALELEPDQARKWLGGDPLETGILLAGLHDFSVRDVLPFAAGTTAAAGLSAVVTLDAGGEAPAALEEFLMGTAAAAPDWVRVDRLWDLGTSLLAAAQGEDRCALLCVLAWIEWARGRSSAAAALLDACLKGDPDYALAVGLKAFLDLGRLPGWARAPGTAWKRGAAPRDMPGAET